MRRAWILSFFALFLLLIYGPAKAVVDNDCDYTEGTTTLVQAFTNCAEELATKYTVGGTDVAIADGGTGQSTAALGFAALKQAATTSATGVAEIATTAEAAAQTDTSRYVTPEGLGYKPEAFCVAASDETTSLTTGTAKVTFRMPYAFTVTAVRMSVATAATGASLLTVDINEGGTTILSTKLTTDASEKTSTTAATAAVISDSSLADDAEMTVDIDQVGSTIAGAGLKVCIIGRQAA